MEKWYLIKLVFRIVVRDETQSQFDIQLRLIQAANGEEALRTASEIGYAEEEKFLSGKKTVEWKFIAVESVSELPQWKNGMEIYSDTHTDELPEKYIREVTSKAAHLPLQLSATFVEF